MAKEKDLIRKIIKWFKEEGGKAVKNHGSIFSEVGNPDIFASHPKIQKAIVIEAKQPGEKLKPIQDQRLLEWKAAGALAFCTDDILHFRIRMNQEIHS